MLNIIINKLLTAYSGITCSKELEVNETQLKMLKKWRARFKRAQIAQNDSGVLCQKLNYWVGIPVIVLATIAGALTFSDLSAQYKLVPGFISVLAAVLASIQTFLKFSEKADLHRLAGGHFGELKKEIEFIINFPPEASVLDSKIDSIRQRSDQLTKESPSAMSVAWKAASRETQDENNSYSV